MADLVSEAVTGQAIGRRSRQEDAVVAHFCESDDIGLAVLSDGMGGHDDGDLASRILAGEMFGEMFLSAARRHLVQTNASVIFNAALNSANTRLRRHIDAGNIGNETGGTLVALMLANDELRWISVGDSPLYLLRGDALRRLNQDHSMAPQIDLMVENGEIDAEEARLHPERNCLTSAVTGHAIPRVDCPVDALQLEDGDIVILASDGLDTLDPATIRDLALLHRGKDGRVLVRALLEAVGQVGLPDQDNTSLVVIKVEQKMPAASSVIYRLGQEIGDLFSGRRLRADAVTRPQFEVSAKQAQP